MTIEPKKPELSQKRRPAVANRFELRSFRFGRWSGFGQVEFRLAV